MVSPTLIAVPLTIVPAMGLLWLMLHRYEGYFEDARVFFALVAGFFAGILVAFLESQFDFAGVEFIVQVGSLPAFILFVAGYAFFETGAKTVVLGLARFRKRKDTPYYASAFGLGFGSMLALALMGLNLRTADQPLFPDYQFAPFLCMAALFLGGILAHGGSTVWVGKGSAEGKLVSGWVKATALQMPILACYWFYWPSTGIGNQVVIVPAVAALVYGTGLLVFANTRILELIVPQEIRDMVQKERRREAREKMREPPAQ
ncbi:MAG: hypothetical protein WC876_08195 [Candidatus Thermoplasmatota archaeon]